MCRHADQLRREVNGDRVSYVVNRNVNYTNVCYFHCRFCAFSKQARRPSARPALRSGSRGDRAPHARGLGAGRDRDVPAGRHPPRLHRRDLSRHLPDGQTAAPAIHVHAFSPLEVWQGARTLGVRSANSSPSCSRPGSALPGTAAEILDDEVRRVICPDKIKTAEWLEVMRCAHGPGLRSTATVMFGHVDHPRHWARHLLRIRDLQAATGGFTEFVPLPFVHMEAPIYLKGGARKGPTWREALLMHAIARLVLHPHITNIQTSWVKMGPQGAQACLAAGANDLGGTLMNESITRAAGAAFGQELPPQAMHELIGELGRVPCQRTTLYGEAPAERVSASFGAAPLEPVVNRRHAPVSVLESAPWCASDSARAGRSSGDQPVRALPGIPAIRPGDDLARILGDALEAAELWPRAQDVLVVTHKIVSKAEGRYVSLADVTPSPRARARGGHGQGRRPGRGDPVGVTRGPALPAGLIIAEHRLGMVLANAGVDQSNVPRRTSRACCRCPRIPMRAARCAPPWRALRALAVVVSDSVGRMAPRRRRAGDRPGPALLDLRGRRDLEGRALEVTQVGLADEIASAAQLLMGEADEGRPAVLVRGWRGKVRRAAAALARAASRPVPMSAAVQVVALSGGIGGAKLALGLYRRCRRIADGGVQHRRRLRAPGLSISPTWTRHVHAAGRQPGTGWGRAGETWSFMAALEQLGGETWFRLGDADLATHVERTRRLAAGESLSAISDDFCRRLGVAPGWSRCATNRCARWCAPRTASCLSALFRGAACRQYGSISRCCRRPSAAGAPRSARKATASRRW